MTHISRLTGLVLAGSLALCIGGIAKAQNGGIAVTVNGSQISFPGTQPVEMHGSVLVPLRGVFQALGAHVDYDADNSTISAFGSGHHIHLAVNSSMATIDGQDQQLSQPAQVVNGSTLVPLRFVAEALGDYVEWDAASHTVIIQTETPPAMMAHHSYNAPEVGMVIGTVRRVITDTTPQKLEVTVNGAERFIKVSDNTSIRRGTDRASVTDAGIADLRRGDRVWIHENDHGFADKVTAIFTP